MKEWITKGFLKELVEVLENINDIDIEEYISKYTWEPDPEKNFDNNMELMPNILRELKEYKEYTLAFDIDSPISIESVIQASKKALDTIHDYKNDEYLYGFNKYIFEVCLGLNWV